MNKSKSWFPSYEDKAKEEQKKIAEKKRNETFEIFLCNLEKLKEEFKQKLPAMYCIRNQINRK